MNRTLMVDKFPRIITEAKLNQRTIQIEDRWIESAERMHETSKPVHVIQTPTNTSPNKRRTIKVANGVKPVSKLR